MSLETDILVAPGYLYMDVPAGPASAYASGTLVGAVSEPIVVTYEPHKLVVTDHTTPAIRAFRDVGCSMMLTFKLMEITLTAKKLFYGDNRVHSNDHIINIPGSLTKNVGEEAPYHQFLYVTESYIASAVSEESYGHNIWIPMGFARAADGSSYELGNVIANMEVDIICAPARVASDHAIYAFRQAQIANIADITIVDWDGA